MSRGSRFGIVTAGPPLVTAMLLLTVPAERAPATPRQADYVWHLPAGIPEPKVPADNPMSDVKVELGRRLFYDTRLSGNGTFACANCHQQARGFADALPKAVGSTGQVHPRNSMGLTNIAFAPVLTWANPNQRTLEAQALVPMFGETPVELGLAGKDSVMLARLAADSLYPQLFRTAFPGAVRTPSLDQVTKAIAAFERTLISGNAPYDRFRRGDSTSISVSARRGESLFFSERLECFHCHGGFNLTNSVDYVGKGFVEIEFHNTGLYNIHASGDYPADNIGLKEHTSRAADMGRFKAPTLRNIALTAPYMHDGSIATLDGVLAHYEAGGRTIAAGPLSGIGRRNPYKSGFVKGFQLTPGERRDVLAFLNSLTDSSFITDPRFSNPFLPHAAPR